MKISFSTHQGNRAYQQDRLLVNEESGLFVVADGMGGHANGDLAADSVVKAFKDFWIRPNQDLYAAVVERLEAAHQKCVAARDRRGSTALVVLVKEDSIHCFSLGDSYIFIDGDPKPLIKPHEDGWGFIVNAVGIGPVKSLRYVELDRSKVQHLLIVSDGIDYVPNKEATIAQKITAEQYVHDYCEYFSDNFTAITIDFTAE